MEEKAIGKVSHYYGNIGVAVVELTDSLKAGETIRVKGATTDFTQEIQSMQVEHKQVAEAKAGEAIGLKVEEKVRNGDAVFKINE